MDGAVEEATCDCRAASFLPSQPRPGIGALEWELHKSARDKAPVLVLASIFVGFAGA